MVSFPPIRSLICLLVIAIAMPSCVYDYEGNCEGDYYMRLNILNHWAVTPAVYPEGMAYFFFPQNGGDPWRFDIPGADGGEVKVPNGSYRFITLNDDFTTVALKGDSYEEMEVTTVASDLLAGTDAAVSASEARPARSGDLEQQDVRMCPDMMWSDAMPSVVVGLDEFVYTIVHVPGGDEEVVKSRDMLLNTTLRPIVSTYHFTVTGVTHLDGVKRIGGAMSGLAASISLAECRHSSEVVTVPVGVRRVDDTTLGGEFLTFGLPSAEEVKTVLSLFVWLTDGRRINYEFDVTRQTVTAPDPMDVWIRIDGLDIPESEPSSGAFDVSVDTWNTIVINISD
ncbi:MAG: DUF5119 domain-containing protein [Lachnospiraceae bacterium]|nr:DUF5119 domain-containing protein [Lachnospiraceae bacterium]